MASVSFWIQTGHPRQLTHRNSGFSGAGRTGDKNRASGYAPFLHHLEDHSSCLSRLALTDHALRRSPRLKVGIKSKSMDVRVDAWNQYARAVSGTKDIPIRSILVTSRDEVNGWREMLAAWASVCTQTAPDITRHCV
jgi:hypothetical protein